MLLVKWDQNTLLRRKWRVTSPEQNLCPSLVTFRMSFAFLVYLAIQQEWYFLLQGDSGGQSKGAIMDLCPSEPTGESQNPTIPEISEPGSHPLTPPSRARTWWASQLPHLSRNANVNRRSKTADVKWRGRKRTEQAW